MFKHEIQPPLLPKTNKADCYLMPVVPVNINNTTNKIKIYNKQKSKATKITKHYCVLQKYGQGGVESLVHVAAPSRMWKIASNH